MKGLVVVLASGLASWLLAGGLGWSDAGAARVAATRIDRTYACTVLPEYDDVRVVNFGQIWPTLANDYPCPTPLNTPSDVALPCSGLDKGLHENDEIHAAPSSQRIVYVEEPDGRLHVAVIVDLLHCPALRTRAAPDGRRRP